MQTFLMTRNFQKNAEWLDSKRLNKQIIEAFQIFTISVQNKNHPAILMWHENEKNLPILLYYIKCCCNEYTKRFEKIHAIETRLFSDLAKAHDGILSWEDKFSFVSFSHRVNLLRKNFNYYSQWFMISNFSAFPDGYFWINPVGKKGKTDTENWLIFFKKNLTPEEESSKLHLSKEKGDRYESDVD